MPGHSVLHQTQEDVEHLGEIGRAGDALPGSSASTGMQPLHPLALCDVAAAADQADDLAGGIAQRQLRRGMPPLAVGPVPAPLLDIDIGEAREHDVMFLAQIVPRHGFLIEVEVALADQVIRPGLPDVERGRIVGQDEAALAILDEEHVRDLVDERPQKTGLMGVRPTR